MLPCNRYCLPGHHCKYIWLVKEMYIFVSPKQSLGRDIVTMIYVCTVFVGDKAAAP